MNLGTTVTEHLLRTQAQTPMATGSFTRLLTGIIVAAKIIQREVNKAGLVDILGTTGRMNVQGEVVRKLDDFANDAMTYRLQSTGEVCALASEEVADLIEVPRQFHKGNYLVIFDPLDGSANIDANVSIGTIFSILRRITPDGGDGSLEDLLQPGRRQVAAG
ncbi:MAG: class 1 fructose-bisphosphatase, partial [Thermodesulfobacteriota bacterium]